MHTFKVTLVDSLQFKREIYVEGAYTEKEMESRLDDEGGLSNFGCRILKVEQMIQ